MLEHEQALIQEQIELKQQEIEKIQDTKVELLEHLESKIEV